MATVYCDNCGTSLLEETAKFCRACGKPTPLSEAATKRFDEQPAVQSPTAPVGTVVTGPAYMAPFGMPPAPQTEDLRQKKQKRNLIIIVSMLVVMIFALGGLLAFLSFRSDSDGIAVPGVPPPVVDIPKPPPPPPIRDSIEPSLIYPGARETTSVVSEGGKRVVILRSNDSATKIADWYIARLGPTKKVTIAGQTFLKAGDIGIMITGGDEGAQITITRGGD
jgi:hypothetical protein